MIYEVVVPKLGVSVNEAKIIQWLRKEGDHVSTGEPFFVVETEKATVDVEANVSGRIVKTVYPEGAMVQAGRVVALVAEPGETPSLEEIQAKLAEIVAKEDRQIPPLPSVVSATSEALVRASPAARRFMREHAIDPATVIGTGPGSTITLNDLVAIIPKTKPGQSTLQVKSSTKLSGTRLVIAQKLAQINTEAVHVTLVANIDATPLHEAKLKYSPNSLPATLTELLIPLVARALRQHPEINAIFEDGQIKIIDNINIAVAVDTPDGLRVPVLRDADKLSLSQVVEKMRTLSDQARLGKLTPEDMSGGTFTITNLGMFGVEAFTPIINPPQCAILGVGSMEDKPVVRDGKIIVRRIMTVSLSFDHRIMDGVTAAKFLNTLRNTISSGNYSDI